MTMRDLAKLANVSVSTVSKAFSEAPDINDNIAIGEYTETALTTIDTNPEQICEIAWDLIQKKLKNPYFKSNQNIEIISKLVIRESIKNINE